MRFFSESDSLTNDALRPSRHANSRCFRTGSITHIFWVSRLLTSLAVSIPEYSSVWIFLMVKPLRFALRIKNRSRYSSR